MRSLLVGLLSWLLLSWITRANPQHVFFPDSVLEADATLIVRHATVVLKEWVRGEVCFVYQTDQSMDQSPKHFSYGIQTALQTIHHPAYLLFLGYAYVNYPYKSRSDLIPYTFLQTYDMEYKPQSYWENAGYFARDAHSPIMNTTWTRIIDDCNAVSYAVRSILIGSGSNVVRLFTYHNGAYAGWKEYQKNSFVNYGILAATTISNQNPHSFVLVIHVLHHGALGCHSILQHSPFRYRIRCVSIFPNPKEDPLFRTPFVPHDNEQTIYKSLSKTTDIKELQFKLSNLMDMSTHVIVVTDKFFTLVHKDIANLITNTGKPTLWMETISYQDV